MQLLFSPLVQQAICVAAKLKLADLVVQPKTATQLASLTQSHPEALYRVMRLLESVGIFYENEHHQFELTPMASLLRSDVKNTMHSFAKMMGEDWLWQNWGELMHCVKTGETAQRKVHGMGGFEFFSQHPKAGEVFNKAMTELSESVIPAIVEAYDFAHYPTVADIAGGQGMLLVGILKANPLIAGVLFEQPEVLSGASTLLQHEGALNRVKLLSGDFLESIPAGADLYLMKHILHDWDDEVNKRILSNIQKVMSSESKLLIIEMIVPQGSEPSPSKIMDLQMLIMEGGKERTQAEYGQLLAAAQLQLLRIIPTRSAYSIIEASRI
ncbi:methyltransferase [soil metagenome]